MFGIRTDKKFVLPIERLDVVIGQVNGKVCFIKDGKKLPYRPPKGVSVPIELIGTEVYIYVDKVSQSVKLHLESDDMLTENCDPCKHLLLTGRKPILDERQLWEKAYRRRFEKRLRYASSSCLTSVACCILYTFFSSDTLRLVAAIITSLWFLLALVFAGASLCTYTDLHSDVFIDVDGNRIIMGNFETTLNGGTVLKFRRVKA